ncbi:MAG: hypothetical protein ACKVTZ_08865 [Bacteroidia bacterium]
MGCNTRRRTYHPCPKQMYDKPLAIIEAYIKRVEPDNFYWDVDPRTFFRLYADSINLYDSTHILPKIFTEFCMDYKYNEYWAGTHDPLCLRVGILSYVTNAKSLSLLMKEHKDTLQYLCNRPYDYRILPMPNLRVSWHILMKIRLKKLKKAKKR